MGVRVGGEGRQRRVGSSTGTHARTPGVLFYSKRGKLSADGAAWRRLIRWRRTDVLHGSLTVHTLIPISYECMQAVGWVVLLLLLYLYMQGHGTR